MSYQIGIDTINLKPTPRLAHTEYCSHHALMKKLTGADTHWLTPKFCAAWDIDFIWNTNDGPGPWAERGRVTDMGHADFLEGGIDRRQPAHCPFTDAEEVLAFDAVKEYGLPDFQKLVAYYEQSYQEGQRTFAESVFTGGYYKTIVSGAIDAFGWDMLLLGAAEPDRFEKVLDSFYRLTLHHMRAWAATTAPVIIQHDDFVWSEGPFMNPEFYRRVIIPRYRELWKPLRAAGKKVLFCSDANWDCFVDDIAEAGADGFIFEPMMALDLIVKKYGRTKCIIGSKVDTRTLTFGTKDQIRAEVDATLELAFDCPGYMFAVGNHIPSNVPVENAEFYFDYLRSNWKR